MRRHRELETQQSLSPPSHFSPAPLPIILSFSPSVMSDTTPLTVARHASLSFTVSQSLLKLMSIELMMPSNHLILRHALLHPCNFSLSQGEFITWNCAYRCKKKLKCSLWLFSQPTLPYSLFSHCSFPSAFYLSTEVSPPRTFSLRGSRRWLRPPLPRWCLCCLDSRKVSSGWKYLTSY